MHILDKIVQTKMQEVAQAKAKSSIEALQSMPFFTRKTNSLVARLKADQSSLIIAEHKRKSPSKGIILKTTHTPVDIVSGYAHAEVAGSSILTDYEHFGGSLTDLILVRNALPTLPLLRKDFIIDSYQLYEAKANGADVILLIAACLTKEKCVELAKKAKELHLEVLLEVHDADELISHFNDYIDILGVNNRNLKTFEVSLDISVALASKIPNHVTKITESGIHNLDDFLRMYEIGYRGFLIGEQFMKTDDPGLACQTFIAALKQKLYK